MTSIPEVGRRITLVLLAVDLLSDFWPTFDLKDKKVLQLKRDNVTLIPDYFDLEMTNFLNTAEVLNEFEK